MTRATTLAIDGGAPVRAERLPLHKPWFDDREQRAFSDVMAGTHVVAACERVFERMAVLP